jgi:N-acetylglucosamine transport system permease protein
VRPAARQSSSATLALRRPRALIVVFLAPAVFLYGLFFAYPMARAVYLSLCKIAPASQVATFIGLANYRKLLSDPNFGWALVHNFIFLIVGGTASLVLSLAIALALTRIRRGRDFFRVVFLFPNVMPVVVTSILWSFVFNPAFGLVNGMLRLAGLDEFCHAWLGEPRFALPALILIGVWGGVGFYIVLFYAGILRIPTDYLDAAKIDGANGWQEFRHVTLPLLGDLLKIAVTYIAIHSLNIFALVYLVTETMPDRHLDVVLTYMFEQYSKNANLGYACAIGVSQLVVLLALSGLINRVLRRDTVEL